jgi:DNA-binding beta-propeller fold protein YncE
VLISTALVLALSGSARAFEPLSNAGSFGEAAGQLDEPWGVAIGADGASYVAEYGNNRVSVFAADGTFLRAIGKEVGLGGEDVCTAATGCREGLYSDASGGMAAPKGLAFGPEGNLFVADAGNDRIDVFTPAGAFLYAFGLGVNLGAGNPDVCTTECHDGGSGAKAGEMDEAAGMAFDAAGLLYFADNGNHRIDVFDPAGGFVRAFGKDVKLGGGADTCTAVTDCKKGEASGLAGAMRYPEGIGFGPGGLLAVADTENHRVDVFTAAGAFVRAFGKEVNPGVGDICTSSCQEGEQDDLAGALSIPIGIAADTAGALYVSDRENRRVNQFSFDGAFTRAFGEGVLDGAAEFQICTGSCQEGAHGFTAGSVLEPEGLAVDCRGAVHVAEEETTFARIGRFGDAGTAAPPCPEPIVEPISAPAPVVPLVRLPSNRIRFSGLRRNLRNGTAVLFVRVPGPGRVILHGRGIRRIARVARRVKRLRLPIKPKVRLKRFLKRHRKGAIRAKVTFRPNGGVARTIEKRVVLKRKRHRRH